ncbi:hypothetical protein D3C80_1182350 [compost metagenome]
MPTVVWSPSSVTVVVSVVSFSVSCSNLPLPPLTDSNLLTSGAWPPVNTSSLTVTTAEPEVPLAGTVMVVPSLSLKVRAWWLLIGRPAALVRVTV